MTRNNLDAVELFRLVALGENTGSQFFDDPQRFNRFFGKGISRRERHLLKLARRIVKSFGDSARELRICGS
jgi:hypothetical protein